MFAPRAILGHGFVNANIRPSTVIVNNGIVVEKKWMQKAKKSIERRGTEGICTGKNFGRKGGPCPSGSRQHALAKTFKKSAKKGGKK